MILTVTPNPCVDKTIFIDELRIGTFIRSEKYSCIPGGKGTNVSRAIKQLGGETVALVIVGGFTGKHVVNMIEQQDGVKCLPIWVSEPTRTITTVLETSIHRQTAFFEPGPSISKIEQDTLEEVFKTILPQAKVVTFNGTIPDNTAKDLYKRLIPIAKKQNIFTILDSHGPEMKLGLEAVPYMLKPNLQELEELYGNSFKTIEEIWEFLDSLHEKGISLIVVSQGAKPLLVSTSNQKLLLTPPQIKEVNPVGSGDALVAAFAIGLERGWELEKMATWGCAAGAANAMSWDIGHFKIEDVEKLLPLVQITHVS